MSFTITDYKDIGTLPIGTVAMVAQRWRSVWVKTGGSTWASLPNDYAQGDVDACVSKGVNNISPCNSEPHTILNPEFVIAALIKGARDAKRTMERHQQAASRAMSRLQDIEAFVAGDHECEATK